MRASSPITSESADADRDVQRIIDLVRLSRVCVLQGEPGSDTTTFLRDRFIPLLKSTSLSKTEVCVSFDCWEGRPLETLLNELHATVANVTGTQEARTSGLTALSLATTLSSWHQKLNIRFVIVFDQFEKYLRAPQDTAEVQEFHRALVLLINASAISGNFVLALDAAAAPLLSGFAQRIPGLGDALMRVPKSSASPAEIDRDERWFGSPPPPALTAHVHDRSAQAASSASPVVSAEQASFNPPPESAPSSTRRPTSGSTPTAGERHTVLRPAESSLPSVSSVEESLSDERTEVAAARIGVWPPGSTTVPNDTLRATDPSPRVTGAAPDQRQRDERSSAARIAGGVLVLALCCLALIVWWEPVGTSVNTTSSDSRVTSTEKSAGQAVQGTPDGVVLEWSPEYDTLEYETVHDDNPEQQRTVVEGQEEQPE